MRRKDVLDKLLNCGIYLSPYKDPNERAARHEQLIAYALSHAYCIPYIEGSANPRKYPRAVVWRGRVDTETNKAQRSQDGHDCEVNGHGYSVLVDVTRTSGKDQWKELLSALKHRTSFVGCDSSPVFSLLVSQGISKDTFDGMKQKAVREPLAFWSHNALREIIGSVHSIPTIRHIDLYQLLQDTRECICNCTTHANFGDRLTGTIASWTARKADEGFKPYVSHLSYLIMRKSSSSFFGDVEIFGKLQRSQNMRRYSEICKKKPELADVWEGLVSEGLAVLHTVTMQDERILEPVHLDDYELRKDRLLARMRGKSS